MLNDLRFALRSFLKNPEFALACIFTLGLGIGANTAIFCVVDAVLLRRAPFADTDRLVMIWETDATPATTREPGSLSGLPRHQGTGPQLRGHGGVMAAR